MTGRLLAGVVVLAGVAAMPLARVAPQPETVAIRFGRLWTGDETLSPAVVVVRGDRILSVGGADQPVPAEARWIDQASRTGLPGLIDLLTHMTYYWDRAPGTRPLGQRRNPAVTVVLAQDNARATLETGVTT